MNRKLGAGTLLGRGIKEELEQKPEGGKGETALRQDGTCKCFKLRKGLVCLKIKSPA